MHPTELVNLNIISMLASELIKTKTKDHELILYGHPNILIILEISDQARPLFLACPIYAHVYEYTD